LPVAREMVTVAGVSTSVSSGSVSTVLVEAKTATGPSWGMFGTVMLKKEALDYGLKGEDV
jgi:hypothetical protein